MSAAKATSKGAGAKQSAAASKRSAASTARRAASGAAKGVAKSAAKGAAKGAASNAAKGAKRAASSTVAAGGDRLGRGTRWSEEQVSLLMDTVAANPTAKEAFEKVAAQLGKSAGTVAQKYYNLQKASNGAGRSPGRPPRSGARSGAGAVRSAATGNARAARSGGLPTPSELRTLTVDDLTGLAMRVKGEIDRRRSELDAASKALKA